MEGLYIEEAMRASANSMSRELAQLASYFQLVFLPDNVFSSESGGLSNARTLLNMKQLATKQKPNAPNLSESLVELSQFTPTTTLHHHHQVPVADAASASASMHSRSAGGLMRGLGGIFTSSSSFSSRSLPQGGSSASTNPAPFS